MSLNVTLSIRYNIKYRNSDQGHIMCPFFIFWR
nr:MAG TPA_asm: hypothetical protein [Caudoviricetes sp.]DAV28497.1 MAG TPA: hypothetical protein [Caudoviricetes sp.]